MKRDFFLPVALAAALAGLGVYAASGTEDRNAELEAVPLTCQPAGGLSTIAGVNEASGLATSQRNRNTLWTHNDSGEPAIYALDADGTVRGRLRLVGASVGDWEAVTTASCAEGSCLYVGDIGDNDLRRSTITIYRTPEPAASDSATPAVAVLEASYPDGAHDAEAMFVANGSLYVVTKGEKSPIGVYRFPTLQANAPLKLERVVAITGNAARKGDRITDAAVSPDGTWVALRTNDRLLFYKTAALTSGSPGTPLAYDLQGLKEPQGEGLAWGEANTIYLAGEGAGGGTFARLSCNLPRE